MKREGNGKYQTGDKTYRGYNEALFLYKAAILNNLSYFIYGIELMPIPCAVTASLALQLNVGCTINFIVEFKIEI